METYSFPLKWHDMSPLTDSTKYTVHIKSADSAGCVTLIWRWDQNLQGQRPSSAVLGSTVEPLAEDERECRLCRFFNTSGQWRRGTGELLTWMFWSLRGFQSSQDQSSVLCKTCIVTFFFFLIQILICTGIKAAIQLILPSEVPLRRPLGGAFSQ